MQFFVNAIPKQVPLLSLQSLQRTTAWHREHADIGCIMLLEGTGCLVGMLEAANETELRRALDSYPDGGCYGWTMQAATPMSAACTRDLKARTAPRAAIPTEPSMPASSFPSWMTANTATSG